MLNKVKMFICDVINLILMGGRERHIKLEYVFIALTLIGTMILIFCSYNGYWFLHQVFNYTI